MKVLGVAPPVREQTKALQLTAPAKKSWQRFAAFFGLECGLSRAPAAAVEGQEMAAAAAAWQPKARQWKAGLGMHRN